MEEREESVHITESILMNRKWIPPICHRRLWTKMMIRCFLRQGYVVGEEWCGFFFLLQDLCCLLAQESTPPFWVCGCPCDWWTDPRALILVDDWNWVDPSPSYLFASMWWTSQHVTTISAQEIRWRLYCTSYMLWKGKICNVNYCIWPTLSFKNRVSKLSTSIKRHRVHVTNVFHHITLSKYVWINLFSTNTCDSVNLN